MAAHGPIDSYLARKRPRTRK